MRVQTCRVCNEEKSVSLFTFRKPSGKYRTDCGPCRATSEAAKRYGCTVGDIAALAEKQGNRCAICNTHRNDITHASFKYNPLVIDHDHSTGAVRGLLCPTCNNLLGHAKDNVATLAGAIAYLTTS